MVAQTSTDARISYLPVTERVTQVTPSVDSASPSEMMGHSQSQEDKVTAQELTKGACSDRDNV